MAKTKADDLRVKQKGQYSEVKKPQSIFLKSNFFKKINSITPKSRLLRIFLLLIVLLGILFFSKSLFIAATVNGKPISRLTLIRELEKQGGKQTLDSLITKELILSEASKQKIVVSDDQVNQEIEKISKQIQDQGSSLEAVLASQEQTLETLRENIKIQKTLETLLKDKIQVSDDEIKNYYEQNQQYYPDSKYEDIKEDLKRQLTQEKLVNEYQNWISKLKSEANIRYFVNF